MCQMKHKNKTERFTFYAKRKTMQCFRKIDISNNEAAFPFF